jgi:hypothetical protein
LAFLARNQPSSVRALLIGFCLWEGDVGDRLLRVNIARPFVGAYDPTGVILDGNCEIADASSNEWLAVIEYLKKMPASLFDEQSLPERSIGVLKEYSDKDGSIDAMIRQVSGGTQNYRP